MPWTPEEQVRIDALAEHGSIHRAAEALGMSFEGLRTWLKRRGITSTASGQALHRTEVIPPTSATPIDQTIVVREIDPIEIVQMRRQIERSQAHIKALMAEIKAHSKRENLTDDMKEFLAPLIVANVLPVLKPLPIRRDRTGSPITLVWHLTDLHWGEIVDPDTIQHANAYSPEIAARRIQYTVDTILAIAESYAPTHWVDEIVVVINGDTVGGSIHPEGTEYYARVVKQCCDVSMVLAQVFSELASRFSKVRYLGTVGNHPRSTVRVPTGTARIATSWERMIHELTAALLAKHDNIEYQLASGYTIDAYIGPSRWAFSHGDATKGGGGQLGIPAYGLKKQHDANREWSVVMAQMTEQAIGNSIIKHTRSGHFHTFFYWVAGAADIALCPSPKGTDPYVKDILAKYSPAMMLVEVVHPEHDLIAMHPIVSQHIMDDSEECRYHWCSLEGDQPAAKLM